jgi:hypothetical protein
VSSSVLDGSLTTLESAGGVSQACGSYPAGLAEGGSTPPPARCCNDKQRRDEQTDGRSKYAGPPETGLKAKRNSVPPSGSFDGHDCEIGRKHPSRPPIRSRPPTAVVAFGDHDHTGFCDVRVNHDLTGRRATPLEAPQRRWSDCAAFGLDNAAGDDAVSRLPKPRLCILPVASARPEWSARVKRGF